MTAIYHERQCLQQCLRHAINALAQRPAVSSAQLDALADRLAPGRIPLPFLHPHRTFVLGCYDVNVLELALSEFLGGKELRWHDQRNDLDVACFGIIVNTRVSGWLSRLLPSRHWAALRCLSGVWYDLDSRLDAPQPVCSPTHAGHPPGSQAALRDFLLHAVTQHDAHVFTVWDIAEHGGCMPGAATDEVHAVVNK